MLLRESDIGTERKALFPLTRVDKLRILACAVLWAVICVFYAAPIVAVLFLVHTVATVYGGRWLDRIVRRKLADMKPHDPELQRLMFNRKDKLRTVGCSIVFTLIFFAHPSLDVVLLYPLALAIFLYVGRRWDRRRP